MPSCSPAIERCKPLLGTLVGLRVHGLTPADAHEMITRCFVEMAEIHRLMSFQEPGSDISRLNREAHLRAVSVDPRTVQVLRHAAAVSIRSEGVFDITVASQRAAAPLSDIQRTAASVTERPFGAPPVDPRARWSDVVLLPDDRVSFLRPLWIDVSGIAKGYAVDRVMEIVTAARPTRASVNAGGDMRVFGDDAEQVRLDVELDVEEAVPVVELQNGSMASSGARSGSSGAQTLQGMHIDGASGRPALARFVSVVAPTCVIADALTKVVMARGFAARPVLRSFAARAIMSDQAHAWAELT